MHINKERLWKRLMELSEIGKTEKGGVTRLSFTNEERAAKELITNYLNEAGCSVWEDEVGNLFGRLEGKNPNAPVILIGSHIDSVFNGGNFDGPLGVLSGIEVIQTLREKSVELNHPVEVVAFTDEEGARFSSGMIGSKGLAGQLTHEEIYDCKDPDGISVAEAMEKAGFDPAAVNQAKRDPSTIKHYLELHIEQGKILENANLPVGLVSGIVGVRWLKVIISGEAGHAGTTPMNLRKDPLVAAAMVIQFAEESAKKEERAVITVGSLKVVPGGVNIIPSQVEFTLDIRDLSEETLFKVESELRGFIATTCETRGLPFKIEVLHSLSSAKSSSFVKKSIHKVIEEEIGEVLELPSGAGHDAMVMADITEMGMVFVRSKDGISHNPKEWSTKEDCAVGAEVLYKTVLNLSNGN